MKARIAEVEQTRPYEEGPFPVNNDIAGMVPKANEAEQRAMVDSIKQVGQILGVLVYKGQLVDGRSRQDALRELKQPIIYIEIPDTKTVDEVRARVFSNHARRNLTVGQQRQLEKKTKKKG